MQIADLVSRLIDAGTPTALAAEIVAEACARGCCIGNFYTYDLMSFTDEAFDRTVATLCKNGFIRKCETFEANEAVSFAGLVDRFVAEVRGHG